ncbi:ubiquinone biosynthesis protein COQ4 [Sneathiella marina]|uniref:Ubiquinone biosynthesis protein COQ4 n=1 Tax=Sneathiella marina TaxID=2950108 RepID=A0ABY4W5M0_9PROT|nr:ubiquinone biosynthesis protein COQ4 [Sneathiella marina]USG62490.1 ubiquinone biosynthesis protein COQ4 [Sneathiella marina]
MDINEDQARYIMAVLKMIATANGTIEMHDIHRRTIEAIAKHLLISHIDLESLPGNLPEAAEEVEAKMRHEVIHIAAIMAVLEVEGKGKRAQTLAELAKHWKLEKGFVLGVTGLVENHKMRIFLHVLQASKVELGGGALTQVWDIAKARLRLDGDKKLLARYQSYRNLPEGTLGHEMLRYYDDNGFNLPGKPDNYFSNALIKHDFHHVLSGYSTSPLGEIAVQFFDAGISKIDYSSALVALVAQFQIAMTIDSTIPTWINQFDPEIAFLAMERGQACTENYLDEDYDFYALATEKLSDIRKRFNISEQGMLVSGPTDKWCGPLGKPYERANDELIKPATLKI